MMLLCNESTDTTLYIVSIEVLSPNRFTRTKVVCSGILFFPSYGLRAPSKVHSHEQTSTSLDGHFPTNSSTLSEVGRLSTSRVGTLSASST